MEFFYEIPFSNMYLALKTSRSGHSIPPCDIKCLSHRGLPDDFYFNDCKLEIGKTKSDWLIKI